MIAHNSGQHSTVNVYPLVDALGFPLQAAVDDTENLILIGGASQTYEDKALGIRLKFQTMVEETTWQGLDSTPVGVMVRVIGDLGIIVLNDGNRDRMETVVVDLSKSEGRALMTAWWSRKGFMQSIRDGIAAHYLWDTENLIWVQTPKPSRWVDVYLEGREEKLSSGEAMDLADYVAHGIVADAPGIARKWAISTTARRKEMMEGA